MSTLRSDVIAGVDAILDRLDTDTETPCTGIASAAWSQLNASGFDSLDALPDSERDDDSPDHGDALAVVETLARRGALTPVIEHGAAAWLCAQAGHRLADGTTATLALGFDGTGHADGDRLVITGTATDVPHLRGADVLVLLLPKANGAATVVVVDASGDPITVTESRDLIGLPVADVEISSAPTLFHAPSPIGADRLRERVALGYGTALAGAARAVLDRTLAYAGEREQFGRALTRFQAIQQTLAGLAARTTLMETAVAAASDLPTATTIAAAKSVTSRYAEEVAAAGHQIHGAIGFTAEYPLGRFTTSLWTWRDRAGDESLWNERIAAQILDEGADPWDLIVGETS